MRLPHKHAHAGLMHSKRLRAIAFLMPLVLISCASQTSNPIPCPHFPLFQDIDQDSRNYIEAVLQADPGDPVLKFVLSDVVDTTAQNNITWYDYTQKLEVRAGCWQ